MQKGTWEGASWHCKRSEVSKTSQYLFGDSDCSRSSCVLTEVQNLNKEEGCWRWGRQNWEIAITILLPILWGSVLYLLEERGSCGSLSFFLLSAFAESRDRHMTKNLFGAERSTPRGLSGHRGQRFPALVYHHTACGLRQRIPRMEPRGCAKAATEESKRVVHAGSSPALRKLISHTLVSQHRNLLGQKWQIQQTQGGNLIFNYPQALFIFCMFN